MTSKEIMMRDVEEMMSQRPIKKWEPKISGSFEYLSILAEAWYKGQENFDVKVRAITIEEFEDPVKVAFRSSYDELTFKDLVIVIEPDSGGFTLHEYRWKAEEKKEARKMQALAPNPGKTKDIKEQNKLRARYQSKFRR